MTKQEQLEAENGSLKKAVAHLAQEVVYLTEQLEDVITDDEACCDDESEEDEIVSIEIPEDSCPLLGLLSEVFGMEPDEDDDEEPDEDDQDEPEAAVELLSAENEELQERNKLLEDNLKKIHGLPIARQGTFSWALLRLRDGHRMTRYGWNGKGQHVQLVKCPNIPNVDGGNIGPFFAIHTSAGRCNTWVPSVSDLLADDWKNAI